MSLPQQILIERVVMRKKSAQLSLALALGLVLTVSTTFAAQAAEIPTVRKFSINGVNLLVVEDSQAPIRLAIFPGIENESEKFALIEGRSNPCYAFAVERNGKTVLVDTGWGTDGKRKGVAVERFIQSGVNPATVEEILITHMHIDHISGLIAKGKAVFPNAKLYISKPEFDYWVVKGADKDASYVELARTVAAAYEGRIELYDFGQTIVPGILAEAAVGHTPGHTAFTIEAGNTSITLIGDMIHAGSLQYRFPEISPTFDVDPVQSSATRKDILDRISERNGIMAGGHIWEVGYVKKNAAGGYTVTPLQ